MRCLLYTSDAADDLTRVALGGRCVFKHTKKYIPARDGEYPTTLCDYSHAKDLLNWIPTKNIHDFIQEFVNNQK